LISDHQKKAVPEEVYQAFGTTTSFPPQQEKQTPEQQYVYRGTLYEKVFGVAPKSEVILKPNSSFYGTREIETQTESSSRLDNIVWGDTNKKRPVINQNRGLSQQQEDKKLNSKAIIVRNNQRWFIPYICFFFFC
jgi:hypothetical protein